jgi:hypothetical protein
VESTFFAFRAPGQRAGGPEGWSFAPAEKARGVSVTLKVANATEPIHVVVGGTDRGARAGRSDARESAFIGPRITSSPVRWRSAALAAVATTACRAPRGRSTMTRADASGAPNDAGPESTQCTVATSGSTIDMCASLGDKVDTQQRTDLNLEHRRSLPAGALRFLRERSVTWFVVAPCADRSSDPTTGTDASVVPLRGDAADGPVGRILRSGWRSRSAVSPRGTATRGGLIRLRTARGTAGRSRTARRMSGIP